MPDISLTPYLMTLEMPFGKGDVSKPGESVYVVADVPVETIRRLAKFGHFHEDGHSWWEDGMQSSICHTMHLITAGPEKPICCGYCAMNDPNYFMVLGRLVEDEFCRVVRTAFADFMRSR